MTTTSLEAFDAAATARRPTATHVAVLAVILLFAAGLRAYRIGHASLWADEIASLRFSCGRSAQHFDFPVDRILRPGPNVCSISDARPVSAIWHVLKGDTHPPLYWLLLRGWRSMFGDGDVAARSLSAVCSLIALLLLYDAVRLLHGAVPGLWAAGIMALASPQIEFAQETRGYAMLVMWTLAAANATSRIEMLGASPRRAAALSLSLLGGIATHYYGAAAFAAVAAYALLRFRRGPQRRALVGSAICAAAVFASAFGPLFWSQRMNFQSNLGWLADDRSGLAWRTLHRICILPLRFLITPMQRSMYIAPVSCVFFVVPLLLLRRRPDLLLWCLLAGAAVALPAVADLVSGSQSLNKLRFTLPAAAPIYALGSAMLSDRRGWLRHVMPAILVVSCAAALPQAYARPWKPDWRGFVADVAQVAGPKDVWVFYQTDPGDWYHPLLHAGIAHYCGTAQRPLLALTGPADATVCRELREATGIWIFSNNMHPPLQQFLPGATAQHAVFGPYIGQAVKVNLPVQPASTNVTAPTTAP